LLAGCGGAVDDATGESDDAIIGGSTDSGDPAVVMLRSGSSGFCTGTLISPTVVLTAAHCVEGGDTTSVGFGTNGSSTPAAVKEFHHHPQWNTNDVGAGYDIAVLILRSAVAGVTPIPFNRSAGTAPQAGSTVRIVGFGQNSSTSGFGVKRTANTTVSSISSRFINVGRTGTQKCFGDSGGPTFFTGSDGVTRVVGVTSYGNSNCTSGGTDTRVDAYAAFVGQYVGSGGGDTTKPTVALTSPAAGSTVASGQTSLVVTATDNVAVDDVTLSWLYNGKVMTCGAPASGWTCSRSGNRFTFGATVGTGQRNFTLTANDTSGNSATTGTLTLNFQ
jgi:secreted trypsin-like serine protease